jgi:hypothetical protein
MLVGGLRSVACRRLLRIEISRSGVPPITMNLTSFEFKPSFCSANSVATNDAPRIEARPTTPPLSISAVLISGWLMKIKSRVAMPPAM